MDASVSYPHLTLHNLEEERDLFYSYRNLCLKNPNAKHAQSLALLLELLLTSSCVALGKPQPCALGVLLCAVW